MKPPLSPLPVTAAPDPVDADYLPLLGEPLAGAYAQAAPLGAPPAALRERLLGRLAASRAASQAMTTSRPARLPSEPLAPGVRATLLYAHDAAQAPRPGEPLRARLVELDAGATWPGPAADLHREWLLLRGRATLGGEALAERDYHVDPQGSAGAPLASPDGALLFLRESALAAEPGDAPFTVRDAEAGWPAFAPGLRRRVLWQRRGQAALLYHADPGAAVPQHAHGHDEECLMLQGELFLDDVLLRPGDYQLAPAGSGHHITETDTGVVIYAHGDLDLRFTG
ncbi:MAG: cupin domain-containing protein [Rubrivivax sp.]